MSLDERMAKVEGALEQMDKRIAEFREDFNTQLNHLETEMATIREKVERIPAIEEAVKALNTRMDDLRDSMRTEFTILAIIVAIAGILVPILIRIIP